jgi:hypothetical protein
MGGMNIKRHTRPDGTVASVEINGLALSFEALLRHVKKLPGVVVERTTLWIAMCDPAAEISYRGHRVEIGCPFGVDYMVSPGQGCPDDVFLEVAKHLEAFRPWFPNRIAAGLSERYRAWQQELHQAGRESVLGKKKDGPGGGGAA